MFEMDHTVASVRLNEIPRTFLDPLNDEFCFQLISMVDFKPATTTRRSAELDGVAPAGHYTTIAVRPTAYEEYDDLRTKSKRLSEKYIARPTLLIYFKYKNPVK